MRPTVIGATKCPACHEPIPDFAFVLLPLQQYERLRRAMDWAEAKLAEYSDPETHAKLTAARWKDVIHELKIVVHGVDSERLAEIDRLAREQNTVEK